MKSKLCVLVIFSILLERSSARPKLTVSGLSSGAAMAVQFHVAFSSDVQGAAIIAGAPYYCAHGNHTIAVTTCSQDPSGISVNELIDDTNAVHATQRTIDDPTRLANSTVWLYSGKLDSVVARGVVLKLETYYKNWIPSGQVQTVYNISSEHAFITNKFGNNCSYLGSPFINNCNYDSVSDFFTFFFGRLYPPVTPISKNVLKLNQLSFVPTDSTVDKDSISLGKSAYYYVPSACNKVNRGCRVHVAFHGCEQTIADIKSDFYRRAGYNRWAEANNIIVLYPQAKSSTNNPKGCWDWWGYTGANYATQVGVQMATVKNIVDYLFQTY